VRRHFWFCWLIVLTPVLAFTSQAGLEVATGVVVSGGRGTLTILQYPLNVAGQTADCTPSELSFPPYYRTVNCTVARFFQTDYEKGETYTTGSMTTATSGMQALADSLVRPTVFETSVALAGWIHTNVVYDMELGQTSENAEWTFANRRGTCDEQTHLLLGLVRHLGYNARYISGFAFGDTGWLPHAWAEVWTEYGWQPFDVTFGQFGVVDASHVTTHKGQNGNHSFVLLSYTGQAVASETYQLAMTPRTNLSFDLTTNATDTGSGQHVLITLRANNPLPVPVAFPLKWSFPHDFQPELVFGERVIVLKPGSNTRYLVFRTPVVPADHIYHVPYVVGFQEETANSTFRVSTAYGCPVPEAYPDSFMVDACIDLNTGRNVTGKVNGGPFMCGECFYNLTPSSYLNYSLFYPTACFDMCNLTVNLWGLDYAEVIIDDESQELLVRGSLSLGVPVGSGSHTISVNGETNFVNIASVPDPEFTFTQSGKTVCVRPGPLTGWQMEQECFDLPACGISEVLTRGTWGNHTLTLPMALERRCGPFTLLWEKVIRFLSSF